LSRSERLHVSGCAKGCARPDPAAYMLTATAEGYRFARRSKAADALDGALLRNAADFNAEQAA
jgi:sulfite reductase beta subunit-like hemoprotein